MFEPSKQRPTLCPADNAPLRSALRLTLAVGRPEYDTLFAFCHRLC